MSNQSENINELATALSKAQGEMQAAIKDSVNPFFKSKYADLGSVWDAARPVLSKHGLCVIQATDIINDKIVMVTTLAHSSGQWMKSIIPLNPAKNDSQGIGASITYLRRYSLSAIVGVVCDEDDDGNKDAAMRQEPPKKPQPAPKVDHLGGKSQEPAKLTIMQEDVKKILDIENRLTQEQRDEFKKNRQDIFGDEAYYSITVDRFDKIIKHLERTARENEKGNNE